MERLAEKISKEAKEVKKTPGVGGPTPGGTAGGNYSYFFFVLALALGFAAAGFFFGAAFFFVAANSLTPFQVFRLISRHRVSDGFG